jgi:hypothetical protein
MNNDKGYLIVYDQDPNYRRNIRVNLTQGVNSGLGICEQLRFVHDCVWQLPDSPLKEEITEKLVDALIMAKRMMKRLNYYAKKYPDNTGHKGKNIILLQHNHSRMRMRKSRIL